MKYARSVTMIECDGECKDGGNMMTVTVVTMKRAW